MNETHECEQLERRKSYTVHSSTTIRKMDRRDGGGWRLELRKDAGDFDCLDIGVRYCPFCGLELR